MASNYNLVVDFSNFKPFDISLALATLRDYGKAYDKYDALLNKIAEEKGEYILPESSKYKEIMDKYNADFDTIVSDFNKGMNYKNATDMRNLVRRYSREVTPIRTMVLNYNKYNDKMLALGPDAIVGTSYAIDDFYGGINPTLDYRSAKQVEADSAKYFMGINNALTLDPIFKKILGGQSYLQIQKGGLNSKAALEAALVEYNNRTGGLHSEDVLNLLGHMENVMKAQGVEGFSNEAKQRVWNKIADGLVDAITAPNYREVSNRSFETPSEKRQIAYQRAQMLKDGYVYNSSTGLYEYDEDAAAVQGGLTRKATLPDGSEWTYNLSKKQWVSNSPGWDGIARTSELLISERNRLIKELTKLEEELVKKLGETGDRTMELYLELAKKFKPLNYRGWSSSGNWKYLEGDSGYYYNKWYGDNEKLSDTSKEAIKPEVKADIINKVREQNPGLNIGWEDLDIYEDHDAFSNNHYRVVIKGTGERGMLQDSTTEYETPLSTTGSTVRGNDTLVLVPDTTLRRIPQGL